MATSPAHFEIDHDKNRKFIWRLRARGNSEIIAEGEGYPDKRNCEAAIALFKRDVTSAPVQDLTRAA